MEDRGRTDRFGVVCGRPILDCDLSSRSLRSSIFYPPSSILYFRSSTFFPRQLAQLTDNTGQTLARDDLHRVKVHAALTAHVIDGHNVGVVQLSSGLRFVLEALELPRVQRRGKR